MASACWSTVSLKYMKLIYFWFNVNKIKTLVFLKTYTFYTLLQDGIGEGV